MASRGFYTGQTQLIKSVEYALTLNGAGAGNAPTLGVGDANAAWFLQPTRTSQGIYLLRTIDPYPQAPMNVQFAIMQASGAGTALIYEYPAPAQNSDNSWSVGIKYFVSGSVADPLAGDLIRVNLTFTNSVAVS